MARNLLVRAAVSRSGPDPPLGREEHETRGCMSDPGRRRRRVPRGPCISRATPGCPLPCLVPLGVLDSAWVSASAVFLLLVTLGLWRHYLLSEQRRRRLEEEQHESLFLNNVEAVASLDPEGVIRRVNPAFASLFGRPESALSGRRFVDLVAPDERSRVLAALEGATKGVQRTIEATIWQKAGERAEVELTSVPILVDDAVHGAYEIVRDITDRKKMERQLEDRALHDYLTGLPNRALFTDRLRHALDRVRRDGGRVALLYVDLDRFKPVNDRAGHAGGDDVLRGVAGRLSGIIRDGDTVARIGGDEFAILLEDLEDEGQAAAIAERIVSLVRTPFNLRGEEFSVGASVGVAISSEEIRSPDHLVRQADLAMYEAKRRGGFRHRVYSQELESVRSEDNTRLEGELRRALERNELNLLYQPIVDLSASRIVGLEALIRWTHPDLGPLTPSHFIPIAEKSSLIAELDRWVLDRGCREVAGLSHSGATSVPLYLSVNLSARHFEEPDFVETISDIILATEFDPDRLQLEITESAAGGDMEKVRELKALGVKVAIDDFGTGFSSLGYLRDLEVDVLKVDKSFVLALGADPASVAIVRTILTLADMLELEVIVEGIENPVQLTHLEDLGGRFVQGYYFGQPAVLEDLPDTLASWPEVRGRPAAPEPGSPARAAARGRHPISPHSPF